MSTVGTLELFSGIGGMSLGLHSEGFKTHGFDASELAVAMANENGLAGLVPFWFSGRRRSLAKGMAWAVFIV